MPIGNQSPPIINQRKPENAHQKPTQTAWIATFKRILKVPNTRYAFLWLTGALIFGLFGKRAIRRREEELMINDIENYLANKTKKDLK
jgi:hypothetical protein